MPILNLLPRDNMLFGSEGIELYKSWNYIDSHTSYPKGTNYDFTTRLAFNADGRATFSYNADVTGGVTIEKGGLTLTAGKITVPNNTLHTIGDDVEIGDGNIAGCLVIHGLNAATGISFKPYSGSTEQRITTDGSGHMIISGSVIIGATIITNSRSMSYIDGANGKGAALFAKKQYNTAAWYPAVTLETKGGGSWQIGNYNDELLQFVYATKANRDSNTNSTTNLFINASNGAIIQAAGGTFTGNVVANSTNRSGTYIRNIRIENSGGTALSSNYILVRRG